MFPLIYIVGHWLLLLIHHFRKNKIQAGVLRAGYKVFVLLIAHLTLAFHFLRSASGNTCSKVSAKITPFSLKLTSQPES